MSSEQQRRLAQRLQETARDVFGVRSDARATAQETAALMQTLARVRLQRQEAPWSLDDDEDRDGDQD